MSRRGNKTLLFFFPMYIFLGVQELKASKQASVHLSSRHSLVFFLFWKWRLFVAGLTVRFCAL